MKSETCLHKLHVAIVGGGPAGLFCAWLLLRSGAQVTLFEKSRSYPIDKVCGEGIMVRGGEVLRASGFLELLDPNEMCYFQGISYYEQTHRLWAHADFAPAMSSGVAIRRTTLSARLIELCQAYAPHQFHLELGTQLQSLSTDADTAVLVTVREGDQTKTKGPFTQVIGADGRLSPMRTLLGWEAPRITSAQRVGANLHFACSPWSKHVEVWWGSGIEAYITPLSQAQIGVIFMWDQRRLPLLRPTAEQLLALFPELAARIDVTIHPPLAPLALLTNLPHLATQVAQRRYYLLGDAACFFDGITGEGLTLAFQQAWLLVQTWRHCAQQIQSPVSADLEQVARCYQAQIHPIVRHYIWSTRLVLYLAQWPRVRYLILALLSRQPRLFQWAIRLSIGKSVVTNREF